jgi:hypothetical protein
MFPTFAKRRHLALELNRAGRGAFYLNSSLTAEGLSKYSTISIA